MEGHHVRCGIRLHGRRRVRRRERHGLELTKANRTAFVGKEDAEMRNRLHFVGNANSQIIVLRAVIVQCHLSVVTVGKICALRVELVKCARELMRDAFLERDAGNLHDGVVREAVGRNLHECVRELRFAKMRFSRGVGRVHEVVRRIAVNLDMRQMCGRIRLESNVNVVDGCTAHGSTLAAWIVR